MEADDGEIGYDVFDSYVPLPKSHSSGSSSSSSNSMDEEQNYNFDDGDSDNSRSDDDDDDEEPIRKHPIAMKSPRKILDDFQSSSSSSSSSLDSDETDDEMQHSHLDRREKQIERRREAMREELASLKQWEDSRPDQDWHYLATHKSLLLCDRLDKQMQLGQLIVDTQPERPVLSVVMPDAVVQAIEEQRRDLRDPEMVRCLTRHLNTGALFDRMMTGQVAIYTMNAGAYYVVAGVETANAETLFWFMTRKDALLI